ncbi:MAG: puromycin-sensitive aminopeptidase, partial [Patescibacteria group bacterium]|nr:puromycin-sensitive aminopeptidase [Patescibacteria group bacterium]
MQKKKTNVRLSKYVVPIKYDIKLHPDLENFTFGGTEVITVILLKDTKEITLHSKEIDIETVRIDKEFSQKITYNQKAETATFVFDKKIPKGRHALTISFQGILNDKMRGFYRSSYVYEGKVHNIATTQFEATDARRAFPCFDEPAQKAIFNVSLVIPKGKTAISNTLPISKVEHEAGFEVVKFAPSPKMSTYLLAFIVGDFEYIEKKSKGGVLVRVYTTPGKVHQAGFSLDCAVKVLDFYEKYFDIKYPLNTLDMIAIPDFASLAMENWGAVTYREVGLLVDENNTSLGSKQMIALVIAHELAHQWFGNLVTMEWWTHLWLNEGFASYIEFLAVDDLYPEWDIWTQFLTYEHGVALRLDGLLNTHPIEIPVHHPDEIGEIFDEVSYSKGSSVIRMLADYLGEEDFRLGLSHYLKKHSYKNTETIHLWEAFEKISKKPVAKMMQNWTGRGGYPVINASLERDNLILKQNRFFLSSISKKKANDKTIWQVPISLSNSNKTQKLFLSVEKKLVPSKDFEWLKLNQGESGFYRTAYSKELLASLYSPVLNKVLPPIDRLGIVRDLFTLAEAGVIPTIDALEFLSAYKNEDNYTVWTEIASGLSRIEQTFGKTSAKSNLDKLTINTFTPIFQKLGWEKKESDSHTDAFLRSLAIARLGRAGDKKIIDEAKRKFASSKSIHPDIRSAVYTIVATHGGIKEYNILVKMYKEETLHEEKNRIGSVLGDFQDD